MEYLSLLNKHTFIFFNYFAQTPIISNLSLALDKIFFITNFSILYVFLCVYSYFKIKKTENKPLLFNTYYKKLVHIGTCYAFFGLTFAALKFSINLERPFCSLASNEFFTIINTKNERCLSSFPSAHAGIAILYSYFLWPYIGKLNRFLCIITVILVAISRMFLAMHYPSDIIFSGFFTILIMFLSNYTFCKLEKSIISPIGRWIFYLLFDKNKI